MTSVFRLGRPILLPLAAVMIAAAVPAHGQTLQWARQFGTAGYDAASAVTTDAAGNIYVGGVTRGVLPGQTSAGNGDAFVSRYAPSGDLIWFRQFGTTGDDGILGGATDVAGYVYVAGFMGGETSNRGTAGLLAKYDAAGNQLWLRQFGPSDFSTAAVDVDTDPAGNVYVAGTSANGFERESFLAKYSASGQQLWSHSIVTATLDPMARSAGFVNSEARKWTSSPISRLTTRATFTLRAPRPPHSREKRIWARSMPFWCV